MDSPLKFLKPRSRLLTEVFRFGAWWLVFSGICSTFEHAQAAPCGSLSCQMSSSSSLTWIVTGGIFALLITAWRHWGKYQNRIKKQKDSSC